MLMLVIFSECTLFNSQVNIFFKCLFLNTNVTLLTECNYLRLHLLLNSASKNNLVWDFILNSLEFDILNVSIIN